MTRKRAELPIVRVAKPRPAAEGSLVYRPGIHYPVEHHSPLGIRAAALATTHDEFRAEALHALALAPAAAYLRFLHAADPAAWRARVLAILSATNGNFSQAADRIGMTYRGLLKAVASDPDLQREISTRWPDRHERGMFR